MVTISGNLCTEKRRIFAQLSSTRRKRRREEGSLGKIDLDPPDHQIFLPSRVLSPIDYPVPDLLHLCSLRPSDLEAPHEEEEVSPSKREPFHGRRPGIIRRDPGEVSCWWRRSERERSGVERIGLVGWSGLGSVGAFPRRG
jgi:hypothetical protein